MKKIVRIEGMKCMHCAQSVQKALAALENVKDAKVDLDKKTAKVSMDAEISDEIIKNAVKEAGFEVISIEKAKSIFG